MNEVVLHTVYQLSFAVLGVAPINARHFFCSYYGRTGCGLVWPMSMYYPPEIQLRFVADVSLCLETCFLQDKWRETPQV